MRTQVEGRGVSPKCVQMRAWGRGGSSPCVRTASKRLKSFRVSMDDGMHLSLQVTFPLVTSSLLHAQFFDALVLLM